MNKTKFNLFPFFEKLKNDWNYTQMNDRFKKDIGFGINLGIKLEDGTLANVYSAGMWYILISDEFANEGFIDAYCKGFQIGKEFIENKTNKALNGFYKSCANDYIGELHYAYFFNAENYIIGYKNGACGVPMTFYIDSIESIGFASGVVCAIDLMAKENPVLFDGFYDENLEAIDLNNTSTTKKVKDYKEYLWFTTGIKLATGEAYELYNKYKFDKGHFTKICLELGFKESDRTYFSSTINDSTKSKTDKNTFADNDKLKKLHKHLTENNLPFGAEFLNKYNQIEAE